jgi:hypothetical protein
MSHKSQTDPLPPSTKIWPYPLMHSCVGGGVCPTSLMSQRSAGASLPDANSHPMFATASEEAGSNDFARIGRLHWLGLLLHRPLPRLALSRRKRLGARGTESAPLAPVARKAPTAADFNDIDELPEPVLGFQRVRQERPSRSTGPSPAKTSAPGWTASIRAADSRRPPERKLACAAASR